MSKKFVLLTYLVVAFGIATLQPSPAVAVLNHAAAFGWQGHANTDLQFHEFYPNDHTLMVRFMVQYPHAYAAPIVSVAGGGQYFIGKIDDQDRLQVNVGGNTVMLDLPNPLQGGVWIHLAVVRSGDAFTFYLDGTQICQSCALSAGPSAPNGVLRLARLVDSATESNREQQFYGFIDDVAVFDDDLDASQILAIASAPRLDGSEPNLYAGYTFDSQTPAGDPLPPELARPVTLKSHIAGPQIPSTSAYVSLVSELRNDAFDAALLPPPFQQRSMRLPFPVGEAWRVIQGWENPPGSHHGIGSFSWDFILAGQPQSSTEGKPILSAAPGVTIETRNDRDSCEGYPASYAMVEHAPEEIGAYLHFIKGSVAVVEDDVVVSGQHLGDAGDTGNSGCDAFHLHYALHDFPESMPGQLVTFPSAFNNYEVSSDGGNTWTFVERGSPKDEDWVRAVANNAPVCDANGPYVAECSGANTPIALDGTGSSDPDGDSLDFVWSGAFTDGTAYEAAPLVEFSGTGMFTVDLAVSDGVDTDMCSADVEIVDTTAPVVSCSVAVAGLSVWSHALVDVGLSASAEDVCDGPLEVGVSVFADEDDEQQTGDGRFSPDARDVAPGTLRLRDERRGDADGRVYLVLADATDGAGNSAHDCCTVVVPHSSSEAAIAAVNAQAAAARESCLANGAPPAGFFAVGDGPAVGPEQ